MELEEWTGHSDVFTVYDGFGLLEGNAKLPAVTDLTVEEITSTLKIIRAPASVFVRLEEAEQVPLLITHPENGLKPLPDKAKTIFVKKSKLAAKAKKKQTVVLKRETAITLHFPTQEILEEYRRAMVRARCPITVDKNNQTLTYSEQHQAPAKAALKSMQKKYRIKIENIV
ncbi:MAG: hypothetical protein GY797_18445 [Deltaproteobacteria bacterium]|nr:hypothetical protein [Deltaproteobacteria bacterium]